MTDVLSGPPVTGVPSGPVTSTGLGRDARSLPTPPTGGHARAPRPLTATHVTAPKEHGHG
ncbi:hypothetical protein [Streptomyces coeruleorubidus]|jgi:hypothetical protein|uniref:Uncharacterized protein n=1 Tax=Streptomyces coeruleorubidus TaxID=116188 RepID=A0ABZ0KPK0_STRC4|nr:MULTISPECIES: hypothetical protein [Streptomyces]WOT39903.1 hypothetical protein R5U08_39885 [Streptomyces coeruleorubidus]GGU12234.1 hypothetical protein GCM10010256_84420 [Streptomyces coeruleorubidus]GGU22744.1 hypothetical protein GCM10010244_56510 [Streptomyces bellus]